ncbi:sulfite exporter TauE/SafE family protein [Jannaschia sp. Os4]|uniref:sulfite exporter TauE/SafE family protein n=1 Tax=Jannaschia sp. Os4 TaxID=2807617 RepID=UPI001939A780|nr:sulfite exporter TauE/SafE family protein [Jannaschia sp. Os4]MBM2577984.1 sulfite exporter TauE/SafE family protein [Jannaschia sp. Os4]
MADLLALPPATAWLAVAVCFAAGAIRGFAGFGLSALAMAALATLVPPVELIPVFWFLEMSASLLLMKGGWQDADRTAAATLVVASGIGLPLGLLVSLSIDATVSKTIALSLLIALAVAQLARLRLPVLATRAGTGAAGFGAGIITGLAGAGGLFIALYAMVRDLPARTMRGTLNIYMLGAGAVGIVTHLAVGTMTGTAATRGLILVVPTLAGVVLGRALFTPRFERYYKPACLTLLIGLAGAGLARLAWEAA